MWQKCGKTRARWPAPALGVVKKDPTPVPFPIKSEGPPPTPTSTHTQPAPKILGFFKIGDWAPDNFFARKNLTPCLPSPLCDPGLSGQEVGDNGAAKLQHQAAVEIEPNSIRY
jgi:hypothetical protein